MSLNEPLTLACMFDDFGTWQCSHKVKIQESELGTQRFKVFPPYGRQVITSTHLKSIWSLMEFQMSWSKGRSIHHEFKCQHGKPLSKCSLSCFGGQRVADIIPICAEFPPHHLNPPHLPHTINSLKDQRWGVLGGLPLHVPWQL